METTERQEQARQAIIRYADRHSEYMEDMSSGTLTDIVSSLVYGLATHPEYEKEMLPYLQEALEALAETDDSVPTDARKVVETGREMIRPSQMQVIVVPVMVGEGDDLEEAIDRSMKRYFGQTKIVD